MLPEPPCEPELELPPPCEPPVPVPSAPPELSPPSGGVGVGCFTCPLSKPLPCSLPFLSLAIKLFPSSCISKANKFVESAEILKFPNC